MISEAKFRPLDDACRHAIELQLSGGLERAAQIYTSILSAEPRHAMANHCLGMIKVQMRQPGAGIPFLLAAVNAAPESSEYWLGYLEALLQSRQVASAREAFDAARRHGLAGSAVDDFAARLSRVEGVAALVSAVELQQLPPTSRGGVRSSRAELRSAARILRKEDNRLLRLMSEHRFSEAFEQARSMTERFPDHGLGWKILGALHWTEGRAEEAIAAMFKSAQMLPGDAEVHSNLGIVLAALKRFDEAEVWLQRAIAINPRFTAAHYRLGMYYELQAKYAEAEASLRTAVSFRSGSLTVDDQQGYSNLLYVLSHRADMNAAQLLDEHGRVGAVFESDVRASWGRHRNLADPDKTLKVGFVSGDFRDHSVGMFLEWVLGPLSQSSGLEIQAYATGKAEDRVTQRLQGAFRHWHAVADLSDLALAQRIQQDSIDILVDLSGHTAENRLRTFARKPAPVQMSWLGYPGTTGLSAMDYYLADRQWLPPERFAHLFTEKLIYMPDRWAFGVHPDAPPVGPLPALGKGHLTFGSFHRISKINASTLSLWARLLHALPDSRLLVAALLDGQQAALAERFAAQGIGPERLIFHGRLAMDAYLGLHNQVDIALDAHPYGGGTTTMHSLSMGVPTLAMSGATSFANACAGILHNAGLTQFVALDDRDFIDQARAWSTRLPELAALRAGMRQRLAAAPAGRPGFIAAHLEAAFRQAWRRWCNHLPPVSFDSASAPAQVAAAKDRG